MPESRLYLARLIIFYRRHDSPSISIVNNIFLVVLESLEWFFKHFDGVY